MESEDVIAESLEGATYLSASALEVLVEGSCVVLNEEGNAIVYAGPIKYSPRPAIGLILLNPVDFEKLQSVVEKHRN